MSLSFAGLSWVRGDIVLGEMLHLAAAKSDLYLDSELAWAGYQVAWAQGYHLSPPPDNADSEKNSWYFHRVVQFAACNPLAQEVMVRGVDHGQAFDSLIRFDYCDL